jgi:hypothetical protein
MYIYYIYIYTCIYILHDCSICESIIPSFHSLLFFFFFFFLLPSSSLHLVAGLQFNKDQTERMVLAMNDNGNVYMKTRQGNMNGAITAPEGSGDLTVDRRIVAALDKVKTTGEPVQLTEHDAERASRMISKILESDFPVEFKKEARELFTKLVNEKSGKKVIRSNAEISTPTGKDEYHVTSKKNDGKNDDTSLKTVAKQLFPASEADVTTKINGADGAGGGTANVANQKQKEKEQEKLLRQREKEQEQAKLRKREQEQEQAKLRKREQEQEQAKLRQREKEQERAKLRQREKEQEQAKLRQRVKEQEKLLRQRENEQEKLLRQREQEQVYERYVPQQAQYDDDEEEDFCSSGYCGGSSVYEGFTGSAHYDWNGNTDGPHTAAGLPDMRFACNRA